MRLKLLIAILATCAYCAGQSVLTTPVGVTQSIPAKAVAGRAGAEQTVPQVPSFDGINPAPADQPKADGSKTEAPANHPGRIVGPLTTRSEFEQYAEDATGRPLPVYGRQLFDEVPTTFSPVDNVPVPADYVLGPGDELFIRAWGKIDLDSRETVNRNGQINLPKVGTLMVAGLRYSQIEGYLHSSISALFKDFELNVSLGQLRSIQIFVLGDARQPGAYTVSSMSTLVDALFTSGGPSATGTMRHIQLRREGITIAEFDIYDLIEKGDKSRDVRLLPGDVILIPPIGPQIAISGDVNRPGIYELKGEATVGTVLAAAGGVTSLADAERAVLERIESHTSREVEEFSLDAPGQARTIKDGDLLRVFPLSPKFSNAVTLRGSVAQPGLYAWKDGMHVSDLIPSRAFLITRDYWNRQNHLVRPGRTGPFASQLTDTADHPGADGSTDVDIRTVASIGQNSAEINWQYALIERLDEHDLSTRLIPFNLGSALDNPAVTDNQLLKPGDVLTVFSRADLELPMEKHASYVRVGGEVNAPGVYRVNPGETLRDVVQRAGGLTEHSYLYASIFTRVSTRDAQDAQLRQSAEQMQRDLITKYANAIPQTGQTAADQQAQLALQQATLARLASVRPTGRVVLNVRPDAIAAADIPDFPLEDGDAFYIPPRLGTVAVAGAVYNANAFRYEPGERLINYLNNAGGATRAADPKRIFVVRADGTVVSRQSRNIHSHGSYENLRLLPGDAIVVPEKFKTSNGLQNFANYAQIISGAAMTGAVLASVLP